MEKIRIYVMTHKPFEVPEDEMYVPLHVGRLPYQRLHPVIKDDPLFDYVGDDTGDQISDQNCYYSELTGMFWAWKNSDADIIGTCHYRRYLLNRQGYMFTGTEIEKILETHDVITTKSLSLNFSYYEGFASHHKIMYLDETGEVIKDLYPEYYETWNTLVHQKHTYFGNMLIARKKVYDKYCEWMFHILFEVQHRVKVEEEDAYHRRIFGFISEFLQYVWIMHQKLHVYECMVGMLGEKAEVSEVKRVLASYFAKGDFEGAKTYFLLAKQKRPDILMEASDVTGELHLCMEVIAIAGLEQQTYGKNLLMKLRDFDELMQYCNHLNGYVVQKQHGEITEFMKQWRKEHEITEIAWKVAESVMASVKGEEKFPMHS